MGKYVLKRIAGVFMAIAVLFWVVACGSETDKPDRYEGTWVQKALGAQDQAQMPRVIVKKAGDEYAFTNAAGEKQLAVIYTEPSESGDTRLYSLNLSEKNATKDGDALKLSSSKRTFKITVNGDKMTWVVAGEDAPFVFTREASPTTGQS